MKKKILYVASFLPIDEAARVGRSQNPAGLRKKIQLLSLFEEIDVLNVTSTAKDVNLITRSSVCNYLDSVVFSPTSLNIPILNLFVNPILVYIKIRRSLLYKGYGRLIIYNYTWETVTTGYILKLFYNHCQVTFQFEDDFISYFKGLRKMLFKFSFRLGEYLTDSVIVNNENMLELFRNSPKYYVFRGIVNENRQVHRTFVRDVPKKRLKVFFGAHFDDIRGIELMVRVLNESDEFEKFEYIITGDGYTSKKRELIKSVDYHVSRGGKARYLGLVPRHEYELILSSIDVGLALQTPYHSFSRYCFPSKVFELYDRNIPVVTTRISDLNNSLLSNLIFIDYSVESVMDALKDVYDGYDEQVHSYMSQSSEMAQQFDFKRVKAEINGFIGN